MGFNLKEGDMGFNLKEGDMGFNLKVKSRSPLLYTLKSFNFTKFILCGLPHALYINTVQIASCR